SMKQEQRSEERNISFFLDHHEDYKSKVEGLVTYKNIFRHVSDAIASTDTLVDIGNGGVFDYDTTLAKRIIAVDLMFTPEFRSPTPKNSELRLG
ncbi:hypothetical protein, partial [Clostridium perfringens]|uniref:hypothetical protein n=1 Tax=Clostridium perfringens TaxID=1502 RepID=UPI0037552BF1